MNAGDFENADAAFCSAARACRNVDEFIVSGASMLAAANLKVYASLRVALSKSRSASAATQIARKQSSPQCYSVSKGARYIRAGVAYP